jgi:tRNA:m4X modification enzyme
MEEWLSNSHHGQPPVCADDNADKEEDNDEHTRKIPRINNHSNNNEDAYNKKNRGKRVPCPIDRSHSVFEGSISKHILVCPAAKRKQEVAGKEYYSEGINLGGCGGMGTVNESKMADSGEAKELAYAVLRVFSHLFLATHGDDIGMLNDRGDDCTLSNEQLQNITESEIYDALPESDLSGVEEGTSCDATSCMPAVDGTAAVSGRLSRAISDHRIRAGEPRHLRQIASILGHMRCEGLISVKNAESEEKRLVIEMGAGRGMTGLVVAGAMGASLARDNSKVQLCLVERSGTRGKAETRIRMSEGKHSNDDCLRLDLVDVTRVRCDLAHVDIRKALDTHRRPEHSSKTVVIAKHLCGAGTDLALKSLRNLASIDGCVFATCCHGLCNWNDYVGRNCLLSLFCSKTGGLTSFGEKQFHLMRRWASASVLDERQIPNADSLGTDNSQSEDDHNNIVPDNDDGRGRGSNIFAVVGDLGLACGSKGLGRACQRLIDHGRCEYMRNTLLTDNHSGGTFHVRLLHYVPRDVTPQNALIIAIRERSSK